MAAESDYFWLRVTSVGDVTVARVTLPDLWKEETIEALAAELLDLVEDLGTPRLVLDLGERGVSLVGMLPQGGS